MPIYRASWVLPISQPPIRDGWLRTDKGRIVEVGRDQPPLGDVVDLGNVALLPGLVNAHTHLELSWMRGRIPQTDDFPTWIRQVISLQHSDLFTEDDKVNAMRRALDEAHATGTRLFGDISNTLSSVDVLIEKKAAGTVFFELIGFRSDRAAAFLSSASDRVQMLPVAPDVHYSLAAHAPYSVSPALFRGIRQFVADRTMGPYSVHLGESRAETQFVEEGLGAWRALLENLGAWDSDWQPPGCRPVDYLNRLGFLGRDALVVHGVQFSPEELSALHDTAATLVTCPRGNRLTGAGSPPISDFYAAGIPVALGTDSLASVPDLNLFNELAELRRLAPQVEARRFLESATLAGARCLGFEDDFGSFQVGKKAAMTAVRLPASVGDVEEYLVGGVGAESINSVPDRS